MWNWKCPGEVEHFCAWTLPLSCQVSSWLHSFHKDELRLLCIRQCWSENESHRDRQLIYYQPPSTQKHRRGVAQCLTPRRTTLGLKCEFSKLAEWESIPDFGNQCQISEIKASFLLNPNPQICPFKMSGFTFYNRGVWHGPPITHQHSMNLLIDECSFWLARCYQICRSFQRWPLESINFGFMVEKERDISWC